MRMCLNNYNIIRLSIVISVQVVVEHTSYNNNNLLPINYYETSNLNEKDCIVDIR